jgi:hypothetical protein
MNELPDKVKGNLIIYFYYMCLQAIHKDRLIVRPGCRHQ